MRLEDASVTIRESVSAEYADLVVAITELGSPTTALLLLAAVFWWGDRRRTALVVSYGVAGLGFVLTLETVLGLPRPPETVWLTDVDVAGYGFPSGHAFASVVVYGGLVQAYDRLRDPLAVAGAGTVIVAVSLSRVVLGVHYLGDVIAGVCLGVAFLAVVGRLTRGIPTLGFALAVAFAVPAVYVTGTATNAVLALGAAIGGLSTAGLIDRLPALDSRLEGIALLLVGSGVVLALRRVGAAVEFTPILVAVYAAIMAWIVVAPAAIETLGRAGRAATR